MQSTRELFNNIEKHFVGFPPVQSWTVEENEVFDTLIIEFSRRVINDKTSIDKATQSLINEHGLKEANYSVYNSSSLPFFGMIINFQKS